ncbi:BamA/TamA family outer membrane protein [Algoriphagus sp.]|uniref:BamA/TamA family outer membrane protein n=1 Tax=Algoriphagus sp. TaxID=1872435 RepID=UPI00260838EC|nr:BamA/TamA family outer membrane protein [Algoriphagus sp.]
MPLKSLPYHCLIVLLLFANSAFAQEGYWLGWPEKDRKEIRWENFETEKKRESKIDSLLAQLKGLGYVGAGWESEFNRNDSLKIRLYYGPKIEWVDLRNQNLPSNLWKEKQSKTLSLEAYNQLLSACLEQLQNTGFPFASLELDSLELKGNRLSGSLFLDKGPEIRWDSVEIASSSKTNPKYLQRLSGLEVGAPFSQQDLDRSAIRMSRLPYFELQEAPGVRFRFQKAQPNFLLRDRNANVIDGIIGLLPNENDPQKVLITGQLDLQLYHLGGRGRDVELKWQRFNELTQSLDLGFKESFVFNSGIDIWGDFRLLKQDSTFLKRHLGLTLGFRANQQVYVRFFTKRQASDLLANFGFNNLTELPDFADFRWNEFGIGIVANGLDQPVFPRRGFLLDFRFSAGNKRLLQNTALPEDLYGDRNLNTPQYALQLEIEKHIYFKPFWGAYLRSASGWIQNENLFLNDLFRAGGLSSIRGFNENFFFASAYSYFNLEQRLFFDQESYLLIFADAGILENPYFAGKIDQPFALGAGLNLDTGSGLFRFIYAVGKSAEQPFSLSFSKIHFGYLARF